MSDRTATTGNGIALLDRASGRLLTVARSRRGAVAKHAKAAGLKPADVAADADLVTGRISDGLARELESGVGWDLRARCVDGAVIGEREWAEKAAVETAEVYLVDARSDVAVYAVRFRPDMMRLALRGKSIVDVVAVIDGPEYSIEFDHLGRTIKVHSSMLPTGRATVDVSERPEVAALILLSWWAWTTPGEAPKVN